MKIFYKIKKYLVRKFSLFANLQRFLYKFKPYPAKFRSYYLNNGWNNQESKSGPGSTLQVTLNVRRELPKIFNDYQISSILDIPCGDFNWMKEIDLSNIDYLGCDIVPELIKDNRNKFTKSNIHFNQNDLLKDKLPKVDLILCRDCLFHFSNKQIIQAINNIKQSNSTYLLTTSFEGVEKNFEIYSDGLFRPINLQLPPYNLPKPLLVIPEVSDQNIRKFLGLWFIRDIKIQS